MSTNHLLMFSLFFVRLKAQVHDLSPLYFLIITYDDELEGDYINPQNPFYTSWTFQIYNRNDTEMILLKMWLLIKSTHKISFIPLEHTKYITEMILLKMWLFTVEVWVSSEFIW